MQNKKFYFDYAASTPVDPRVEKAMRPYFLKKFGNAGSLHSFGQEALAALDSARETVAKAINANFREIIFTGSATEANNLALRGALSAIRKTRITSELSEKKHSGHSDAFVNSGRVRMIVSSVEHESILETARDLEKDGVEVVYLPVARNGAVRIDKLKSALNERTVLVSVMYANNEIGMMQPISEIAEIISDFRKGLGFRVEGLEKDKKLSPRPYPLYPILHTDAVQAFQFLDCDVRKLGVDMLTLSAHKIYGPKGIGALYARGSRVQGLGFSKRDILHPNPYTLYPIITGGGQEFGFRSGTENVPLVAGFAKAVELAVAHRDVQSERIKKLKDYFWRKLLELYPRAEINGSELLYKDRKSEASFLLPNILNVYFPDDKAEYLLTKFDLAGIAVSAGSACSARSAEPSYVITALGYSDKRAKHSIRFSFGRPTTKEDIDSALGVIRKLLK